MSPVLRVLPLSIAGSLTVLVVIGGLSQPGLLRWALAATMLGAAVMLAIRSAFAVLVAAVAYVPFQGLLRRLVPETNTFQALGDPLLLVLPVLALVVVVVHVRRTKLDLLGISVLGIQVGLLVSVLNPLGGGVAAGLAQLLVVALPLTWFWVGSRGIEFTQRRLRIVLGVVATCGLVCTSYARFQVANGFPPWDQDFIERQGVNSLAIGSFIRPFSTFTAASDFGAFLGLSLAAAAALLLSSDTRSVIGRLALALACVIFVRELALLGSRGILLTGALPVVMGVVIRLGLRLRYAVVVGVAGLAAVPTVLTRLNVGTDIEQATTLNEAGVARQLQGFSDPFGDSSTLPGHISRLVSGIGRGLESPIGYGVSYLGPGSGARDGVSGTETSYGDLGVSIGLIGTALGLLFAVALLRQLARMPRRRLTEPDWLILFLGVIPLGPPLVGGNYAAQITYYALLGCAWRMLQERRAEGTRASVEENLGTSRASRASALRSRRPADAGRA